MLLAPNDRELLHMTLKQATDFLLKERDVAEWVRLADQYITIYNESPKMFELPARHAVLQPVIEKYAKDGKGFVAYILKLRDYYDRETDSRYGDLNKLYRRISVRMIQQERRARLDAALDKAAFKFGDPPDLKTKREWMTRREAEWGSKRLAFLDKHRAKMTGGRLTRDEMNDLLDEFYANIDEDIEKGAIPPWDK